MLKLDNISKTFFSGTTNEKQVFKDLSLEIKNGDFVTVIGGNGAGKSTILNSIAGVFKIDSGKIFIDDINITNMPEYKRAAYIGRVFQDPMLGTAAGMRVEENLTLASRRGKKLTLKWSFNEKESNFFKEELRGLNLGLEKSLKQRMGLLSGGQRQAITLLMATLIKPRILLLDEHTAALDPKTAETVLGLTKDIVEKNNLTTLMITHNMKDALNFGNRLIMLNNGKIILDVSGKEKEKLTIPDLLGIFENVGGDQLSDSMILA